MPEPAEAVAPGRIGDHPAVRSWRLLGAGPEPSEVRVLKESAKGIRTSAVYRLPGAGPDGGSVVAKCAWRAGAELEALVYEQLSRLDLPVPAYYGAVGGGDSRFGWLFVEHVPGVRYSPADPRHRRLAGRWIGRLHREAASLPGAGGLPDRGLDRHRRTLDAGRAAIGAHAGDPSLAAAEAATLSRLAALLGEVRESWPRLQAVCAELPPTLVHGDLVRKNLRVGAGGAAIVAFDWEHAGRGPAALDLAQSPLPQRFAANPSLDAYRSARDPAPALTREEAERQAAAGTVLRCLAATHWASLSLGPPWREGGAARRDFVAKRPRTLPRLEACLTGLERGWRELEQRGWR